MSLRSLQILIKNTRRMLALRLSIGGREHPSLLKSGKPINRFVPSSRRVNAVRLAFSYINQYAIDNNISASLIDKRVLSVGHAMSGIVVTDDLAMQSLAETFNISWINTLGLLKLMYERGKATIEDIDSIIEYWKYEKDFPTSFQAIKDWRATLCH